MPARILSARFLLTAGLVTVLLLLVVSGIRGYQDLVTAQSRAHELQSRIDATQARITQLKRDVEALRTDPEMVERVARIELGMVRDDEVVFILPNAPPLQESPVGVPES